MRSVVNRGCAMSCSTSYQPAKVPVPRVFLCKGQGRTLCPPQQNAAQTFRNQEARHARRVRCCAKASNLYEVLGVPETATRDEIRAAYRKVAIKLHPDVNKAPDAKERFIEVKTAYDTLMDSTQRAAYDRSRRGYRGGTASGLGADFGRDWDSFTSYARKAATTVQYSFQDLERDLEQTLNNWRQERLRRGRSDTVSDVIADLGEELLQFLEMGLGDDDDDARGRKAKGSTEATDSFDETLFGIGSARKQAKAAADAANAQAAAEAAAAQAAAAAAAAKAAADAARREAERKAAVAAEAAAAAAAARAAAVKGHGASASSGAASSQAAGGASSSTGGASSGSSYEQADASEAYRRAQAQREAELKAYRVRLAEKQRKRDAEIDNELEALKRKLLS